MNGATNDVGIVGGGLLGLTVAYRLLAAGVPVTVYERDTKLGGLAAATDLDGIPVDRYYHVVLPTDDRVRGLAAELGMGDESFRFRPTGAGFYHQGGLASMSTPRELLAFRALRPDDRLRLGAFALRCQLKRDYADLEQRSLEEWLRSVCGHRLWTQLWEPLLDSKFDGRYDDLPATYLWARSRRMAGTREKGSQEVLGTIDGGYQVLVDRLEAAIRRLGGRIRTGTEVSAVASSGGEAIGVVLDHGLQPHSWVLTTQLRTVADRLLTPDLMSALAPDPCRYLGVVSLVLRLRRSISPYYALNITDRRIPLTTVVETTHVVDPERVGGTLVYLPKYVQPDSPELERGSAEIRRSYLQHLRTIFPALDERDVLAAQVARSRVAEPVHVIGGTPRAPDLFPAHGLAMASSAHVYPELVNGQAILGLAERVAAGLIERAGRNTVLAEMEAA
jgi:protoporphyrinogen oxidase